jgi:hypothetical protein
MSLSALYKFFLPPLIASGSVFAVMSYPLATLGEKQIVIKFQEEPIFHGKLRDVATPYVVLATALSIGAGISAAAICGWLHSSRRSSEYEQELSNLEKHLQEKEALLKEFKVSETRLQTSGLSAFLDDEVPFEPLPQSLKSAISQPVVTQTPAQMYHQPVNSTPPVAAKQNSVPGRTAAATSGFASVQTFLGYAQVSSAKEAAFTSQSYQTTILPSEYLDLQRQLKEMMLQMQTMQNNIQNSSPTTNIPEMAPDRFKVYYEVTNADEVNY